MCPATTKVRFTGGVYGARMFVLLSMAFSMALNGESLGTDRYAPIAFDPATKNWMQFKVGDHVEVSPACSENYQPATVSSRPEWAYPIHRCISGRTNVRRHDTGELLLGVCEAGRRSRGRPRYKTGDHGDGRPQLEQISCR